VSQLLILQRENFGLWLQIATIASTANRFDKLAGFFARSAKKI